MERSAASAERYRMGDRLQRDHIGRRSRTLDSGGQMRSAPTTLAALITAIAFAGCSADAEVSIGGTSIDTDEAEQEISSGLADAYGDPPKTLTCPDDVDAVEGETFACEGR